ncbi:hypothetical protein DFH29DRAFT_231047 [Suillus ampliporus]|nr:hypothetical protein DFH29DRAFT_231047 [Suillus ampliporus]
MCSYIVDPQRSRVNLYLNQLSCKLTSGCIVKEVTTTHAKYCTSSFNIGPMPAIYASIPIICYDIFLVILAAIILMKHLKERREFSMRPNVYVLMIVRCHIIYFVLNLTNQILLAVLWTNMPV